MSKKDHSENLISKQCQFTNYIEKVIIHAKIDYLRHEGYIYAHEDLTNEVPEIIEQSDEELLDDALLMETVTAATLEQIATEKRLQQAICRLSQTEKEVLYYTCIKDIRKKYEAFLQ